MPTEPSFEPIDLTQAAEAFISEVSGASERKKKPLASPAGLDIFLLYVRAQGHVPTHQVSGAITVQGIVGEATISAKGVDHQLTSGKVVMIGGGIPHELHGTTDSVLLVTRVV